MRQTIARLVLVLFLGACDEGQIGQGRATSAALAVGPWTRVLTDAQVTVRRGGPERVAEGPTAVAVGPDGAVYVSDQMNFRIQVFDRDGHFRRAFGQLGDTPGSFARPKGVAVDAAGHVYVVDAAFNNVQVFDSTGVLLLAFGSLGHGEGELWLPMGLAIDGGDRIFVADRYNNRIQVYQYLHVQEGGETGGADVPPDGGVRR